MKKHVCFWTLRTRKRWPIALWTLVKIRKIVPGVTGILVPLEGSLMIGIDTAVVLIGGILMIGVDYAVVLGPVCKNLDHTLTVPTALNVIMILSATSGPLIIPGPGLGRGLLTLGIAPLADVLDTMWIIVVIFTLNSLKSDVWNLLKEMVGPRPNLRVIVLCLRWLRLNSKIIIL